MISVQFTREFRHNEGARGDVRIYPRGLTISIDDAIAALAISIGCGRQVGEITVDQQQLLDEMAVIAEHLRSNGADVTIESLIEAAMATSAKT